MGRLRRSLSSYGFVMQRTEGAGLHIRVLRNSRRRDFLRLRCISNERLGGIAGRDVGNLNRVGDDAEAIKSKSYACDGMYPYSDVLVFLLHVHISYSILDSVAPFIPDTAALHPGYLALIFRYRRVGMRTCSPG